MEEKYTILSLGGQEERGYEFPVIGWKKRLPAKLYECYLLGKLPIIKEEVFYMEEPGFRISLPFQKEDTKENPELIQNFVNRLIRKKELNFLITEKELKEAAGLPYMGCPWLVNYLLFPQIFQKITEDWKIDCKAMKLVLFDPGDNRIEYVLELLLPYLNYLTIVTERPLYFHDFTEYAFEHTGLIVELQKNPVTELLPGNMIIFLGDTEDNKEYNYIEKNAFVLFLDQGLGKIEHMHCRRRDLTIAYDTSITFHGEVLEKELAAEILCKVNWRLKLFAEHTGKLHYIQEGDEVRKRYCMELKEIHVF